MLQNYERLERIIHDMQNTIEEGKRGKDGKELRAVRNYRATLPLVEALRNYCEEYQVEFIASERDNLGSTVEAVFKSILKNKPMAKSLVGKTDLRQGSKNFEIKLVVFGSSSFASSLDLTTKDDLLLITNQGIKVIRNEHLKNLAVAGHFKNGTTRLKPSAINSEYAIETEFTKYWTNEIGLQVY